MKQKPWPVVVLAVVFFLSPIWNVWLSAHSEKISALEYMREMVRTGTLSDWLLVFGVTPLAGFAIWMCRKWSYFLYLAILAFVMIDNFFEWQNHRDALAFLPILAMNLFNLILVTYFLVPQVRQTYWDRRVRWWETKRRFNIDEPCSIQEAGAEISAEISAKITNISEGGAFVKCDASLQVGDDVKLITKILDQPVAASGKVVHVFPERGGFGICFKNDRTTARTLKTISKTLAEQTPAPQVETQGIGDWAKNLVKTGKGIFPEVPGKR